ncbi:hypothetical protein [Pseudonocardia sp. ICBG601]|uniref:hypothetical protein n=1 Tax=Pseudonocardia sp. ICBG601 TaxID=2846759 RepID=UPI001CF6EDF4|nr:hypothetical protein [Pseudonocardia sp. ICBG601]
MELTKEERNELIYYPQADAQMNEFIPATEFKIDLINRLMLEPGILVTDIFFFISRRVEQEIARGNESWITSAITKKLIVPAFRSPDVNFETVLREMRQDIVGILQESGGLAGILDDSVVSDGPRVTWPARMGVEFRSLLVKHLMTAEPPEGDDGVTSIWQSIERYRIGILGDAIDSQSDPEANGVQRGVILRKVAEDLDFKGDPSDTRDLLTAAWVDGGRRRQRELSTFLLWVNEIYHFNQATQFSVRPSFPVENAPGAGIIPAHLWRTEDVAAKIPTLPIDVSFDPIIVPWPTKSMLLRADPVELLAIRTGSNGEDFVRRLEKLRTEPSEDNWYRTKVSLGSYARAVCQHFGNVESGMSMELKTVAARQKLIGQLGTTSTALGTTILSAAGNPATFWLSIAGTVLSIVSPVVDYRLARSQAARVNSRANARLRAIPGRTFEVDFPA